MPSPLDKVKAATDAIPAAVQAARDAQHDAIIAAHEAGVRVADIAAAASLTRQRVYQLLDRAGTRSQRERQWAARLAELDRWYDAKLDEMGAAFLPSGARGEQARRNRINGRNDKNATRGVVGRNRGSKRLPTVRAEARAVAEMRLAEVLERFPNDLLARRIEARLDERAMLRDRLTKRAEARAGLAD